MIDLDKLQSMVPGMTIILIPPTADEDWEEDEPLDEYDDGPDWREWREYRDHQEEMADYRAAQRGIL